MLYAHARIASIVRKIGKNVKEVAKTATITLEHPLEVWAPQGSCKLILSCVVEQQKEPCSCRAAY